jgi:putative salt-induced outer membrane protein YdiY
MILKRAFVALFGLATLGLALVPTSPATASETPGWYFDADLGAVWNGGNSESSAIGAGAELRRVWPKWRLAFSGTASQTETTTKSRFATGTSTDFDVEETSVTEKTSEYFNARAVGAYDISEHFFAIAGVDWMRNRPAGIDSRTLLAAGAGNTWYDTDTRMLRTFYNFTYTFEEDVVENPVTNSEFAGLQAGYALHNQITANTKLESNAVVDFNLDNTDDIRVNWFAALPVSLSSRLELKPSLRVMWRNDPALEEISLLDGGGAEIDKVTTQLSEWDTIFTLALVISFAPAEEG